MKIEIDLRKSLHENASDYFEKSKKAARKLSGLEKAVKEVGARIKALEKEAPEKKEEKLSRKKPKQWFEKFRWFYSSDGFLVLGGRDAHSNEFLLKNHMEKEDKYFHAEIHGAPHVVIKTDGKIVPEKTLEEAACFAVTFSSAWKLGFASYDVYSVAPEQVSKKAPSGESLSTGAFMIYGKRQWFRKASLSLAIGLKEMPVNEEKSFAVMAGPESAVGKQCSAFMKLMQGKEASGQVAKQIRFFFREKTGQEIDLDEIIRALPAGGFRIAGH